MLNYSVLNKYLLYYFFHYTFITDSFYYFDKNFWRSPNDCNFSQWSLRSLCTVSACMASFTVLRYSTKTACTWSFILFIRIVRTCGLWSLGAWVQVLTPALNCLLSAADQLNQLIRDSVFIFEKHRNNNTYHIEFLR